MLALLPMNIRLAIQSLNRNRMRSLLTMLGMIIGVAAVLAMVALGTGARGSVEDEVGSAGTKLIFVKAGNYTRGGESVGIAAGLGSARTLVPADAEAITEKVSGIRATSVALSTRTTISHGETRAFARVQGVDTGFAKAYSWSFSEGEMMDADQAVIGRVLADRLFGTGAKAVGETVEFNGATYRIAGVIQGESEDQGAELFVPWRALQANLGINHVDSIVIAANKAGEATRIAEDVKKLIRSRHGLADAGTNPSYLGAQGGAMGHPDDFTVETQAAQALTKGLYTPAAAFALANMPKLDQVTLEEMASTLDRASDTMTALLASIAGVSLIVGGIGIMNIMLVSVTERTREIGLRMAIGARPGDVAMQFLIEAVMLGLIGGLIGLLLGLASSRLIGWSLGWPAVVSFGAMAAAIGISLIVGLVFGIYPARRASLLDPIDALRSE
ncbi:ABC transporter permease [Novosphingobium sp. BL-52-GroH]|uniref:ABC transporter permease n=1 Tax=Novosphingobium sp. BL-52-GroH TaxID=3349877 RepID=UPI00384B04F0